MKALLTILISKVIGITSAKGVEPEEIVGFVAVILLISAGIWWFSRRPNR